MGKHRGKSQKDQKSNKSEMISTSFGEPGPEDHEGLASLVRVGDGIPRDETGEATAPSNPDLWGDDPFYDRNERPRFAAWALALVLVVVLVLVGGLSWMFGKGEIDGTPVSSAKTIVTRTATVTEQARPMAVPTVRVTVKSQVTVMAAPEPPKTVIFTKTIAPQSTLTAYQKVPDIRVTVRATITRTATSAPRTVYLCYRVRQGEIVAQMGCP